MFFEMINLNTSTSNFNATTQNDPQGNILSNTAYGGLKGGNVIEIESFVL